MVKIKTPKPGTLDVRTATPSYLISADLAPRSKTERRQSDQRKGEIRGHLENAKAQAETFLAVLADVLEDKDATGTQLVLATYELFNEAAWITRPLQFALDAAKACQADEGASEEEGR